MKATKKKEKRDAKLETRKKQSINNNGEIEDREKIWRESCHSYSFNSRHRLQYCWTTRPWRSLCRHLISETGSSPPTSYIFRPSFVSWIWLKFAILLTLIYLGISWVRIIWILYVRPYPINFQHFVDDLVLVAWEKYPW